MLSELQRTSVWENWLAAEIRANYFADMCARYQLFQKLLTWAILVFSSGAAATVISDWVPPKWNWVKAALTIITAALSLFAVVQQNQKLSMDCSDLHFRWNKLAQEYESLWNDMYSADAATQLRRLLEKTAELSKSSTGITYKKRKMLKWQIYVEQHHGAT